MSRHLTPKSSLAVLVCAFACQRVTSPYDDIVAAGAGGSPNAAGSGGTAAPSGGTSGAAGAAGAAGTAGNAKPAGDGGTAEGGAPSPPASGAGGDAGAAGQGCVDLTPELCMKVTWPSGVVPYAGEPSWGDFVWSSLRRAIDVWDGLVVGSGELAFVDEPRPGVPTLRFTLGAGCAPSDVTEDAVTVAIGACPEQRDIVIAIGMALGMPAMHQRADRDRYLLVADPSRFDCNQGRFISQCPDRDGVPAALGPFAFSHDLFAYAAPSAERCNADASAIPYLARGLPEGACSWVTGGGVTGGAAGRAVGGEIAELYAIADGWLPYAAIGRDLGPDAPLDFELAPDLEVGPSSALAATEDGGLALFTLAGPPGARSLWVIENADGAAWGEWREIARDLPEPDPFFGFEVVLSLEVVKRNAPSPLYDVVFTSRENVFHATVDLSRDETSGWRVLDTPGGSVTAARTSAGRFVLYTYAAFEFDQLHIWSLELDGDTWGEWQAFPLSAAQGSGGIAAATTLDGTEHLAVATPSSILHTARPPEGEWAPWTEITGIAEPYAGITLLPGASDLRGIVWHSPDRLWHLRCEASPCTEADSWSRPVALAKAGAVLHAVVSAPDRIDVVAVFEETRPPADASGRTSFSGFWHKQWSAPR